mmetsp:Transcript_16610/g.21077  ORF Transcript_16610/g.21077 Transcript_16610/m.21077 type:complete len:117 (+) Transcript_16610:31-381(+)
MTALWSPLDNGELLSLLRDFVLYFKIAKHLQKHLIESFLQLNQRVKTIPELCRSVPKMVDEFTNRRPGAFAGGNNAVVVCDVFNISKGRTEGLHGYEYALTEREKDELLRESKKCG